MGDNELLTAVTVEIAQVKAERDELRALLRRVDECGDDPPSPGHPWIDDLKTRRDARRGVVSDVRRKRLVGGW
jgi:hypothetical protein